MGPVLKSIVAYERFSFWRIFYGLKQTVASTYGDYISGECSDAWKSGCLSWVLQKAEPEAGNPSCTVTAVLGSRSEGRRRQGREGGQDEDVAKLTTAECHPRLHLGGQNAFEVGILSRVKVGRPPSDQRFTPRMWIPLASCTCISRRLQWLISMVRVLFQRAHGFGAWLYKHWRTPGIFWKVK